VLDHIGLGGRSAMNRARSHAPWPPVKLHFLEEAGA